MERLPARQVNTLLDQFERCEFRKNETVIRQGEDADRLYIVRTGEVKVVTEDNGQQQLLGHLSEGDYFGERALVVDQPRAATVIATEDTECFTLSRERFADLLTSAPQLREQLVERITQYDVEAEFQQKFGRRPLESRPAKTLNYEAGDQASASEPTTDRPAERRKRRVLFRRYPWLRQHDETDCGAACLAMISLFYGVRQSIGALRDLANVGREGASMYSLAGAAEKLGFTTRAVRTDFGHLADWSCQPSRIGRVITTSYCTRRGETVSWSRIRPSACSRCHVKSLNWAGRGGCCC